MRDQRLVCRVEGEELVIRIGIDVLAGCTAHQTEYDEGRDEYLPKYPIIEDRMELAKDVALEILREEEDGSSPLTDLFDQAVQDAFDNGSMGFAEAKVIKAKDARRKAK